MRATEMIDDAENALRMLEDCENEDDFRVFWIACVTILRSIGHVLGKVDHRDEYLAASIDIWWKALKADKTEVVFHEFIEKERNFSIKEYKFNYGEYSGWNLIFEDDDGKAIFLPEAGIPEGVYIPMTDGLYEGEDCRDVLKMAIEWWKQQIQKIEEMASCYKNIHKATEKLTLLAAAEGAVRAVRIKQKSKIKRKKKIAAAVYEYQADCDGEWGEISLDFETSIAEIIRLADWDTTISNFYARKVIQYLLGCDNDKLPKEAMIAFEEI